MAVKPLTSLDERALDVTDIKQRHEGVAVTIRRSKTDQDAEGRQVGIP